MSTISRIYPSSPEAKKSGIHPQLKKYVDAGWGRELLVAGRPDQPWFEGKNPVPKDARGKIPAVWQAKRWRPMYGWQDHDWAPGELEGTAKRLPEKINVSLRCDRLVVLDFDFADGSCEWIIEWAMRTLPRAWWQMRDHRHKLVFLLDPLDDESVDGLKLYWGDHGIEVLSGSGRQIVAEGMHPSGSDYEWLEGWAPWDGDPMIVTAQEIEDFLANIAEELERNYGAETKRKRTRDTSHGPLEGALPIGDPKLMAPDRETLEAAVAAIPNDEDWHWDDYVTMVRAIKAASGGSAEGLDIAEAWAMKRDDYEPDNEHVNVKRRWAYMNDSVVGWDWIWGHAVAAGWTPPGGHFPEDEAGPLDVDLEALAEREAEIRADPELERLKRRQQSAGRFTDTGLAMQFAIENWNKLAYTLVSSSGVLAFNGRIWTPEAERLGRDVQFFMQDVKASAQDEKKVKGLLSAARISAVRKLAQDFLHRPASTFDPDPYLLNTPDGVVDLRKGGMRSRRAEDRFRQITTVSPAAQESPEWSGFVDLIFDGDEELISFLQRAVGMTLLGIRPREHVFFFGFGSGGNGKSTFINILAETLGMEHGYSAELDPSFILQTRYQGHKEALARLFGKRAVFVSELPSRAHFDEAAVKKLTGGDRLDARFLFQNTFEFWPSHTLWVFGNHKPDMRTMDEGLHRRLRIIPFTVTLSRMERADPKAPERLRQPEVLAGVLRWAINGAVAYLRQGLGSAKAVDNAVSQYVTEQDPVQAWIDERCRVESGCEDTPDNLYRDFENWKDLRSRHLEPGERADFEMKLPMTKDGLGKVLSQKGFRPAIPRSGVRYRRGIESRIKQI